MPRVRLRTSGIELGYDEVVALGDFYPSNEAMHNAPRQELTNSENTGILDTIRAEIKGKREGLDVAYQKATEWRDVVRYDRLGKRLGTEGEFALDVKAGEHGLSYLELAKYDIHFAELNKQTWEAGHSDAVDKADKARLEQDRTKKLEQTNDAYTTNALADHFLTDAFAAGHLLVKSKFREVAAGFVAQNHDKVVDAVASSLVHDHHGAIFELVSWKMREKYRKIPVLGALPVIGGLFGLLVGGIAWLASYLLPGFVEGQVKDTIRDLEQHGQPNLLIDVASKVAHDFYNREGVDVSNARGDTWRTFGDENLGRTSSTWQLLSLAVLRSRADVAETLRGKRPADLLEAWTYVPIPPPAFDQLATTKAGELLLRSRDNPAAHLMARNIDTLKVVTAFEERETGRKEEAGKHEKRVEEYLANIRRTGRPEDRMDSDDIAREIVASPEAYAKLSLPEKVILVQEMLTGWTGGADQRTILVVLREVEGRGQLREFVRKVTAPRLRSKFGGSEREQLLEILGRAGAGQ
jgi:hypothetical protein